MYFTFLTSGFTLAHIMADSEVAVVCFCNFSVMLVWDSGLSETFEDLEDNQVV
jgi:hypothetical protein